jgi:hypothetical protein
MRLFLIPVALALAADVQQDVLDLFTDLAASLSANDPQQFLAAFDPKMPGYAQLRDSVISLTREGQIQSSVDVVKNEGDAARRTVEVDWRMRVRRGADGTASAPREQRLQCTLEKRGRKWKIVALAPVEFFRGP